LALQWENPKTLVGDPTKVRLQQGRKELTTREREEITKYGFTGLELMTYVYANKHPLPDNDFINRCINYDGISLSVVNWLFRRRYNYKDLMDKLTHKSVKPGDVEYVLLGYDADSPKNRGLAILFINYARSETTQKNYEQWAYLPALKRVRKDTPRERGDEYYGMFSTLDDDEVREPWEEEHAILGEDSYQGKEVLVVESRHRFNPKYYLSKRVSWVEKTNFLDLHEEQFNRAGQLSKMIDLNWLQVRPTLHWVQREVNLIKLPKGERTLHQNVSWKIGNGYKEADFAMRLLETERPWRAIDHNLPALRQPSDLPPAPKVRMEFWKKLGVTVTIAH
jgi:hypothetical protein